jgi:hypothetical protein
MTLHPIESAPVDDPRAPLRAELSLLDLLLERHILRLRAAQLLDETDFRGLYIADTHVDALLRSANRLAPDTAGAAALTERIEAIRAAGTPSDHQLPALSRFERELLIVAAAADIDLRYQTLFAYAQNDVTRKLPTVALALQLLCDDADERIDRRRAFAPDAPLFRERLVRFAEEKSDEQLLPLSLRADTRVVDSLLGIDSLDARLAVCTQRLAPTTKLRDLHLDDALRTRITNLLPQLGGAPVIVLEGVEGSGRKRIAEAIAAQLGVRLTIFDAAKPMPADALALLRREALLSGDAVVIDHHERIADSPLPLFPSPLFLVRTESRRIDAFTIAVPLPDLTNRTRIWTDALGDAASSIDAGSVAQKFALTPRQIHGSVAAARANAAFRPPADRALTIADLHTGAQLQSSPALRKLAARIELKYEWDDIVLPPRAIRQLRDVCRALEYRHIVHDQWGLGRRLTGTGLAVLFTGASGTGKTMSASIVARALGLEMYRIDLSAVVSKYIGETEKNLERIFTEAQTSNAVLFFDEADALFGKRSEVKDAHDRYANIETAYLLQRMESYDGIVILATNLGRNIDEAFARRMFDTIEFPLPEPPYRERIWRAMLATGAPLSSDVDVPFLSRHFELSGGNIRNVVLTAAFTAAAATTSITMRDVILATARELQKIGRLPSRDDFGEYYEMVREGGG